ncbi:hypothetical protein ONZ45_g15319 [Pleurotus djamor]|nr:hypothetical protein ONZ45_g15319 [Pleurotus djamor]
MLFDAHFWLAEGLEIFACLRYFNSPGLEFDEVTPAVVEASIVRMSQGARLEGFSLEEEEKDQYQVVGDISMLIRTDFEDICQPPHIYAAAVANNSQKELATFDMDCSQWTTAFRHNLDEGKLPIRIIIPSGHRFPDPKKLCPSNDTNVFIAGRLSKFTTDTSGRLDRLHIEAADITLMGKRPAAFTPVKAPVTPAGNTSGCKRKFSYDGGSPLPKKRKVSRKGNLQPDSSSSSVGSPTDGGMTPLSL